MTTLIVIFLFIVFLGSIIQGQINTSLFMEHMDRVNAIQVEKQLFLASKEAQQAKAAQFLKEQMDNNGKVIKDNQLALFSIKESSLFLYDHYNRISDMLSNGIEMAYEDEDVEDLTEEMTHVENNISEVISFFTTCFKMTPEQYREHKAKQGITFKQVMKKPGGGNFESEFSLN